MKQINANLIKVLSACLLLSFAVQCCAATTVVSLADDVTADPGDSVIVPILVKDVTDYGAGTIHITYDPSVVHVTAVTSSLDSTVAVSNINNVSGYSTISASNVYGANGDIVFANVTFTAVGTGSSPMNISIGSLYDMSNEFNKINAIVNNGSFKSGDVSTSPTPTSTTQSTSSNGGSTTGGVSISTPTPSPTPAPSARDDGADPVPTSESASHNDGGDGAETDASGTTSPTVKPTPGSQSIPGFEAIFAVIGLVILSLILRRDNT